MAAELTITRLGAADTERCAAALRAVGATPPDAATLAEALARADGYVLLAESGGAPVGLLTAVVIPKLDARRGFLFVDELTVAPAWRRQGAATALLAAAEAAARALGLAGVRLLARPENAAARRLYARAGYAESATQFYEKAFSAG